jgi:hypothetical protein
LKILQEKIVKTLENTGMGNYVLNRTPITQEIRARMNKWELYIKRNNCLALVVHTCNPSYTACRDQEDCSSKPAWENTVHKTLSQKKITK